MDDFFTVEEFADKLGVSIETVRRWLRAKKIKGVRIGKFWRIPKDELTKLTSGENE